MRSRDAHVALAALLMAAAAATTHAAVPIAPACSVLATNPNWADCASDALVVAPFSADAVFAGSRFDAASEGGPFAPTTPLGIAPLEGDGALSRASALGTAPVLGIPEPHTLALMGAGLVAMGFLAMRRRRD